MLPGSLDGRGVWGRVDTCICMAESLCCWPETITTLFTGYITVYNNKKKVGLSSIGAPQVLGRKTLLYWWQRETEDGPGLTPPRSQPWANNLCTRLSWGRVSAETWERTEGSRLKKGKTSPNTGSPRREPQSVKPAWDYVLPRGQGAGLSDSHPS